jgi:hypothetical protein
LRGPYCQFGLAHFRRRRFGGKLLHGGDSFVCSGFSRQHVALSLERFFLARAIEDALELRFRPLQGALCSPNILVRGPDFNLRRWCSQSSQFGFCTCKIRSSPERGALRLQGS